MESTALHSGLAGTYQGPNAAADGLSVLTTPGSGVRSTEWMGAAALRAAMGLGPTDTPTFGGLNVDGTLNAPRLINPDGTLTLGALASSIGISQSGIGTWANISNVHLIQGNSTTISGVNAITRDGTGILALGGSGGISTTNATFSGDVSNPDPSFAGSERFGTGANAYGLNGHAYGNGAQADIATTSVGFSAGNDSSTSSVFVGSHSDGGNNVVAAGLQAVANGAGAICLGRQSTAPYTGSQGYGYGSAPSAANQVRFGGTLISSYYVDDIRVETGGRTWYLGNENERQISIDQTGDVVIGDSTSQGIRMRPDASGHTVAVLSTATDARSATIGWIDATVSASQPWRMGKVTGNDNLYIQPGYPGSGNISGTNGITITSAGRLVAAGDLETDANLTVDGAATIGKLSVGAGAPTSYPMEVFDATGAAWCRSTTSTSSPTGWLAQNSFGMISFENRIGSASMYDYTNSRNIARFSATATDTTMSVETPLTINAPVTIDDDSTIGVGLTVTGGGGGGPLATFRRDVGSTGAVVISGNSSEGQIRYESGGNNWTTGVSDNEFAIANSNNLNSNVLLTLDSAGDLDVAGGARVGGNLAIQHSGTDVGRVDAFGNDLFVVNQVEGGNLVLRTTPVGGAETDRFTVSSAGEVAIGGSGVPEATESLTVQSNVGTTGIGGHRLHFDRASANYIRATSASGYLRFGVNGDGDSAYAMELAADKSATFATHVDILGDLRVGNLSYTETGAAGFLTKTGNLKVGGGSSYANYTSGSVIDWWSNAIHVMRAYPSASRCISIGGNGTAFNPLATLHVGGDMIVDTQLNWDGDESQRMNGDAWQSWDGTDEYFDGFRQDAAALGSRCAMFGGTPVYQPAAIADAPTGGSATAADNAAKINELLAAIRSLNAIAS